MITIFKNIRQIANYNELLFNLALREIKVKYKQSVLGILWVILQPLAMMVIFTVIFSRFVKVPSDGIPYPIFSLAALLPWSFFASALSHAIPSISSNSSLVTKIYFPREVFPLACLLAALFDFLITSIIFIIMMIFYNIPMTINILYVIPLVMIQITFIFGVSLFASAVNVYYRDVKYIVPFAIQLWMYASPVIYPVSIIPKHLQALYMLNPMAPIIDGYRKTLLLGVAPDLFYLGIAAVVTAAIFIMSYGFFKKTEMSFADVI